MQEGNHENIQGQSNTSHDHDQEWVLDSRRVISKLFWWEVVTSRSSHTIDIYESLNRLDDDAETEG